MRTTFVAVSRTLALAFLLSLIAATGAHAQATRTWVSGVGDDVNPCSRTAPCKTYAGAISKTARNGVISTLDPGGFGTVTITKSITIEGTGTNGSILAALAPSGITVNITDPADTAKTVVLRNISIDGAGTATDGIRVVNNANLVLENVMIRDVTSDGIDVTIPGGAIARISGRNVTVDRAANGVNVNTAGAGVTVDLIDSAISNVTRGLQINGNGAATVRESTILGCSVACVQVNGGVSLARAFIINTLIAHSATGVFSNGQFAVTSLSGATITGNATGINAAGGATLGSYGNNRISGNSNDGAPTTSFGEL